MRIACLASTAIWAASEILDWSYGLSVAVLCAAGLIVPTIALRESLFAPAQRPERRRRGSHA